MAPALWLSRGHPSNRGVLSTVLVLCVADDSLSSWSVDFVVFTLVRNPNGRDRAQRAALSTLGGIRFFASFPIVRGGRSNQADILPNKSPKIRLRVPA
jgi:hypothetical protein